MLCGRKGVSWKRQQKELSLFPLVTLELLIFSEIKQLHQKWRRFFHLYIVNFSLQIVFGFCLAFLLRSSFLIGCCKISKYSVTSNVLMILNSAPMLLFYIFSLALLVNVEGSKWTHPKV